MAAKLLLPESIKKIEDIDDNYFENYDYTYYVYFWTKIWKRMNKNAIFYDGNVNFRKMRLDTKQSQWLLSFVFFKYDIPLTIDPMRFLYKINVSKLESFVNKGGFFTVILVIYNKNGTKVMVKNLLCCKG